MKKILAIILVLSMCVLAFCGCTSKNEEGTTEPAETTAAVTETAENVSDVDVTEVATENQSRPEAVSKPDMTRPAAGEKGNMVIGKIVSVAGNQITIDVAEIDGDFEMPEMNFEDFSMPEGMTMPEGMKPPEGFDGEMPDFSGGFPGGFPGGSFPGGGKMPEGFDPSNMPEGMSMPDFANGEFPAGGQMPQFDMGDIELKYTGTKEKYIIPKTIKVGSGDYTSLSKGMVVGIQLDESKAVTSVMIISQ